jgi:hypothetical protein
MPSGHTNANTINEPRPLTAGMIAFLERLTRASGGVADRSVDQGEQNAARALIDRRMVGWDIETRCYRMTETGMTALFDIYAANMLKD